MRLRYYAQRLAAWQVPRFFGQKSVPLIVSGQSRALPCLIVALLRQAAHFAEAIEYLAIGGTGVEPFVRQIPQLLKGMVAEGEALIAPEDTKIKVTLRNDEGHARIEVRDYGPGVPDSALENLFKPFCTTKATGLGMGLAICRSMLEARGGTLTADNHAEGGALFQMTVPIEAVHE